MTAIETLNAFGSRWADFMVRGLLDATLLLAVVALLWLLLRRRVSAQVGYCLFLLVILKLLVPIPVTVPSWLAWLSPAHVADRLPHLSWSPVAKDELASAAHSPTQGSELPKSPRQDATSNVTASETPGISFAAKLMILWAAIVLLLAARFGWVQGQTARTLGRAKPLEPATMAIDVEAIARRIGVRGPLRIAVSPAVTSPVVWKVLRPQLVLPEDYDRLLTSRQVAWLLSHELAHLRRRDLWMAALQRAVQILHFFNPAVWLANWMIDRQREYACDDAALAACQCSRCDCGKAFLWAVERANGLSIAGAGTVAFFGYRSFAKGRLTRILDSRRAIRPRMSVAAALLLLAVAVVSLPRLHAENAAASAPPAAASPTESAGVSGAAPAATARTRGWLDFTLYDAFRFLDDKEVVKDLRLSPEQVRKIAALEKEFAAGEPSLPLQYTPAQQDELAAVLEPKQLERLRQIRIQAARAAALGDPEIAKSLAITDEQRDEIGKIKMSADEKISELVTAFLGGARSDEEREKTFQQKTVIEKETPEKIVSVLTPEQRRAFEELQGPKAEVDLSLLVPEQ